MSWIALLDKQLSYTYPWQKNPPVSIPELLRWCWKFREGNIIGSKDEYLRWFSPHPDFGEFGDQYWLELILGERTVFNKPKLPNVSFCWLNWDIGSGKEFIHVPNLSKLQNMRELISFYVMLAGDGAVLNPKTNDEVNASIVKHHDVFVKYVPDLVKPVI